MPRLPKAARARTMHDAGTPRPQIARQLKMRPDEVAAAIARGGKRGRGRPRSENVHEFKVRLPEDVMAAIRREIEADGGGTSRNEIIVTALRQAFDLLGLHSR